MNKQSNDVVDRFYNNPSNFGKFIWSTELVKLQKTRTRKVLATDGGTLNVIAQILELEKFEAEVLLEGLHQLGKIKKFIGGGVNGYTVLDKTLPEFAE